MMNTFRQRLIGAVLCLAALSLAGGVVPGMIGDTLPVSALARILDSLAPQFLLAGLLLSIVAGVLGAWRIGLVTGLVVAGFAGWFMLGHLQRSLPLQRDAQVAVRVLFFNTLITNEANAGRIAKAVEDSGADVVALAESEAMRKALPELRRTYPNMLGCDRACNVVILSKLPFSGEPSGRVPAQWDGRLREAQVELGDGRVLTLAALQALKPWTLEPAIRTTEQVQDLLHDIAGPVLVAGDFNAAPWGRMNRALLDESGLRAARVPVPTWPVGSGWAGVPIDNMFVRGGARLVSLKPFGAGLGSNHLGLLAEVALGG
ncbi:endonuclease/exonuclease/phosphatase family protein [Frigidibacter sp. MR17.14]|uniref:endonuclease/exonuclease/phosphatase family protein n=1 Tax=Frigidibacter sp. MR17.14 TaxID=3126509 RepID=UPI003013127C